jgi:hypothetical protein
MPSAANGDNLYIGTGKFYFDRFDPTTLLPTGVRRFVGEVDKGDVSISSTNKTRYTTTKASNNKIASLDIQQTHTLALSLMEFTKENLALAFLGNLSVFTQPITAVTAEAVASVYKAGDILQLAERNPTTLVLTGASDPLVLGTDYEIENQGLGLIRMLTAGTTITAAYTPGTTGLPRIAAGQNPSILGRVIFIGDPMNGPGFDVELWKVKFMTSGVVSLLGTDFGSVTMNGEVLDDSTNHPNAPLYQITYHTA